MSKLTKYILLVVACVVVPAIVVWDLLPAVLKDYPVLLEWTMRLSGIYMTIVSTWLIISFANTFRRLGEQRGLPHRQYLNSFISVLKIVLTFIAAIIVIAIILDKDPSTLFAGLGAASAILMLAFQDTIKGLVAGIRLTSNDMLREGDRITLPSAGADGVVEKILLTTVKVRNFDNTIVTLTPQTLVDGSFQNWRGMKERTGRKAVRRIYIDTRSIAADASGQVNLTLFRQHMEQWLAQQDTVAADQLILVHQLDATPTGLPVEFVFWLKEQNGAVYERHISAIMEHVYAQVNAFGLRIYQQFPEQ